jgi:hypothetical protein
VNDVPITEFQKAILTSHGAPDARVTARHRVHEAFQGQTVWEGEVLEFTFRDGSCYAWEVDGRITSVLRSGPIDSPVAAVRAALVAES